MAKSDDKLRTVRLQIVDEITGEPLEYVNVRTNAKSVSLSDGTFLEDVIKSIKQNLGTVQVSDARLRAALEEHLSSNLHADASKLQNAFIGFDVDERTGVVTWLRYDGTTKEWDTAMEKIPLDIKLDNNTNELILITDGNPEGLRVNFSKFVDLFKGEKTDTTTSKVTSDNHILVHLNKKVVTTEYLSEDLQAFVSHLEEFLERYEDKIDKIEDEANKYILPPATDENLGGIIPGFGTSVDEGGILSTNNITIGTNYQSASPCGVFLEICDTVGTSTDPMPTLEAGNSYITTEGNIIEYNDQSELYNYINASTDGSVEEDLRADQIEAKFVNGLTLIDLNSITWYDGPEDLRYAVVASGDGFVFTKEAPRLFKGYVDTAKFIELFNGGLLTELEPSTPEEPTPTEPEDPDPSTGENPITVTFKVEYGGHLEINGENVGKTYEVTVNAGESCTAPSVVSSTEDLSVGEVATFDGWTPPFNGTPADGDVYTAIINISTESDTTSDG